MLNLLDWTYKGKEEIFDEIFVLKIDNQITIC